MSGLEHPQEQQQKIKEEKLKQDLSFYDRCKTYVSTIYPEVGTSFFYSTIKDTWTYPIINNIPGFNVERFTNIIKNLFSKNASGNFYTWDEKKILLTLQIAGIYKVCSDTSEIQKFMQDNQATQFTDRDLLKSRLQQYLEGVTDTESAGQVFDVLDGTNE